MLYISRCFDGNKFGVVDTDDYVEEVVSWMDLYSAVIETGLDIKGVQLGLNSSGKFISVALPYQDPKFCSTLQVKTRTLLGVDITVYRDEITRIVVDGTVAIKDTRIRLSDFGTRISSHSTISWKSNHNRSKLILVVTDNVDIGGLAPSMCITDVVIDVSEVSDGPVVTYMYKELIDLLHVLDIDWNEYMIDRPGRDDIWRCVYQLENVAEDNEAFQDMLDSFENSDEVQAHMIQVYAEDFAVIADMDLSITVLVSVYNEKYISLVRSVKQDEPFTIEDYDYLKETFVSVFKLLKVSSDLSYVALRRFENCVFSFDATDTLKELYIRLCNNVANSVKRYCYIHNVEL